MREAAFATLFLLALLGIFSQDSSQQAMPTPLKPSLSAGVEEYFGRPGLLSIEAQLADLGVTVFPEDRVQFFPDPSFGLGTKIRIERATPVEVNDGGKKTVVRTWARTVSELLAEMGINLGADDRLKPAKETTLTPGLSITISRVEKTRLTVREAIAFERREVKDENLERGRREVRQRGKRGIREKIFLVTREDGREVRRDLLKTKVVEKPQEEIVAIGVKRVVLASGFATWYRGVGPLSAASNSIKRGSRVRVIALDSGREVVVTILDRGVRSDIVIDLSPDAFQKLASLGTGKIRVRVEKE